MLPRFLPTKKAILTLLIAFSALMACCTAARKPMLNRQPPPPNPKRIATELKLHGDRRVDEYYWMRERSNPQVVEHLEAENAYTDEVLESGKKLADELYDEITKRIRKDDNTVPYELDGFLYYQRFLGGSEYPVYCRRAGSMDADEQIILDVNQLADGHDFFDVARTSPSRSHRYLAYAEDSVGRRIYTIRIKDLETGETLEDRIDNVTGNLAWADDDRTLFYSRQDPETLRSYQIYRHVLGTDPSRDVLIYQEDDSTFSAYVWKSKSKRFIFVASIQTVTSEYHYLPADAPETDLTVILPRERGHEYDVDHFGDHFYIRTNDEATNFRLVKAPIEAPGRDGWQDVICHREEILLERFELFADYLVAEERSDGLVRLRVMPWGEQDEHNVEFDEPTYLAEIGRNPGFDTVQLRFNYSSLTTPDSVYDYDMNTRKRRLRKREEVIGDFQRSDYVTERLSAPTADGTRVPISLVYRKGLKRDGSNPLLLYGYGSYGHSIDASFVSSRLSLLDRGFVFAIAHIRGGQELGRRWYDDGRLLAKKNSFTDFIAAAEHLLAEGYTNSDLIFARGGSAGGLLMGAVVNLRPDLFRGVVAVVPFVDVVTTMLDEEIPLTSGEYDEWGNPNERKYYEYMLSYSPYDNVAPRDYPDMFVSTGFHDSQVQYWEPAKWVARLRAKKTGDAVVLLKTNMEAGHGGASGRYKKHEETALEYAFLLMLAEESRPPD